RVLSRSMPPGVSEIDPNLVSVLLKYDPMATSYEQLAGEVRILLREAGAEEPARPARHTIAVRFGGEEGPDLDEVATRLGLTRQEFIAAHCARPLRVLTTGFAPGFVYCGFHPDSLDLPRRTEVRRSVPAGAVLFAARQTAVAATAIPTGWHVIGRTGFRNFDPEADPPTRLREGDEVVFEAEP
ncbi:MAG TPA: allophanate hydrolase subunit 1, partial [Alphaproteobacteria bacterium]|nr:allophanate hydrolase subunit 1 [Alphaproteobacteria bacterium]